jgi:hypothetical protein
MKGAEKSMMRKINVHTLCAMLLALCLPRPGAAAEERFPDRVLSSGNTATDSARTDGIRLALRERGYIEG